LRKLLTVALAATATLAVVTGAAVAQPSDVTFTATVSPSKAGTKKKPKNTKIGFNMKVDKPATTVEFIDLTLPKGLKMSGKGLGNCTVDDLAFEGPDACKSSAAGPQGTANAMLGKAGDTPAPLNFTVQPFVQDANTLLFYVASESGSGIAVQSPITGEITGGGTKLRIRIPQELRQPGGVDASLTGLNQVFSAKKGKKYLVSSVGCKAGKHKFTGKLTFTARADGSAVPAAESATTSVKCKK
jgi:hypothetical protein